MDPGLYGKVRDLKERHCCLVGRRKMVSRFLQAATLLTTMFIVRGAFLPGLELNAPLRMTSS